MPVWSRTHGRRPGVPSRRRVRPFVEELESRTLLSVTLPGVPHPLLEVRPNDTLDVAQQLGTGGVGFRAGVVGRIGGEPSGSADVDWYQFTLLAPTRVRLDTANQHLGSDQVPVLSLFNNAPLFSDFTHPHGPRLLVQSEARPGRDAHIDRVLNAGTYFVAVSGAGNRWFHPFVGDSGTAGSTGQYGLVVEVQDAGLSPTDGPVVLASDVSDVTPLDRSPLVIRLNFSGQIDQATLIDPFTWMPTYGLTYNPTGDFGDGNDIPINLIPVTNPFASPSDELQLVPDAPLPPGFYRVFLPGDVNANPLVLRDMNGNPLGMSDATPDGADYVLTFEINGVEGDTSGNPNANDTVAKPIDLGDVSGEGLVQVEGQIGDDPAYNPMLWPDPIFFPAGSDVDLYSFRITGPGTYAFIAEAFAGRIGSPLDPGLTLFRANPDGGPPVLVASNDSTLNNTNTNNGLVPFLTDAAVFAGLTAGDYYLAVSSTPNVPTLVPDPFATVFDPTVPHSGLGFTTGEYVLNLVVRGDDEAPRVVETTPRPGKVLTSPPRTIEVEFSENVNLQQLAFDASHQNLPGPAAVFVRDENGFDHYARLLSYDATTRRATFLMLDALENGTYQLHLSGALGLADFAGHPLVGNDRSGDYVVSFKIAGPPRGSAGNPLHWVSQEPNDSLAQPQVLGTLFPKEIEAGVQVVRDYSGNPSAAPLDTEDFYQFEVLQSREYVFQISDENLQLQFFDATGAELFALPQPGGIWVLAADPGTSTVRVSGWAADDASAVSYVLDVKLSGSDEHPTPLTTGPAPAFRIRLGGEATSSPPPQVTPPGGGVVPAGGQTPGPGVVPAVTEPRGPSPASNTIPTGVLNSFTTAPVGGVRAAGPASTTAPVRVDLGRLTPVSEKEQGGASTAAALSGGSDEVVEDPKANKKKRQTDKKKPPAEGVKPSPGEEGPAREQPNGLGRIVLPIVREWLHDSFAEWVGWLSSPQLLPEDLPELESFPDAPPPADEPPASPSPQVEHEFGDHTRLVVIGSLLVLGGAYLGVSATPHRRRERGPGLPPEEPKP